MCIMNQEKKYLDFVSSEYLVPKLDLSTVLEKDYIVTIPNFMSETCANQVLFDMTQFKDEWWSYSVKPINDNYDLVMLPVNDPKLKEHVEFAENIADKKQFAYKFKRTIDNHYNTCYCYACRLYSTMKSPEVLEALSNIVGKKVNIMDEIFASKYDKGDFLTTHHDKNKGNYTFILQLTKDWDPCHGGLTHFVDSNKEIYKTISPVFNTLTIFKLSPDKQMDHFVSKVCGPNSRYAFTGWFSI